MSKFIDMTGMRFGRITVHSIGEKAKSGQTRWNCICDCGNKTLVQGANLRFGKSNSCGCLQKESLAKMVSQKNGHGLTKTSEYKIWSGMITRCFNSKSQYFKRYGGRGVTVCKEWLSFESFINDMGKRPSKKHSIDRINVNGNYEPLNCRWADNKTQMRNKENTVYYTINGITKPLIDWADDFGINYSVVWRRLKYGKVVGDLFRPITPINKRR